MKSMRILFFCFIAVLMWVTGCKTGTTPPAAGNGNANGNANGNGNKSETASANSQAAAPVLKGKYTISEVQSDGISTMISPANRTEIYFNADGSFRRVSKREGEQDHIDGGTYRLDGSDRLVLFIMTSKGTPQNPPVQKTHRFSLSADGETLHMLAADGKMAVFRRTEAEPAR